MRCSMGRAAVILSFTVAGSVIMIAAPPVPTTTSVNVSPNPVDQFALATVTGTTFATLTGSRVGENGSMTLRLFSKPCKSADFRGLGPGFLDGTPDVNGQLSGNPDTSTAGTFGVHAKYNGQGSGYGGSTSPCLDMVVTPTVGCPGSGLTIAVTDASGPGLPAPGASYTWTYRVTVSNCSGAPINSVTAQGGTNGWGSDLGGLTYTVSDGSATIRKANNKNQVLLWTIGSMATNQVVTLDVTNNLTIKQNTQCGTNLTLNGPWSALNQDISMKSDYSGQVLVQVTCP